jgi:alpha-tubulin suppressor-like RCC1 family protein
MAYNSKSDYNVLSKKLKEYFKDNIKQSLKFNNKLFIVTKSDDFYEIDIYNENILSFVSSSDYSIIETMIIKELCNKNILDLRSGADHYFARINGNEIYFWGDNYLGQLGIGKRDEVLKNHKNPEIHQFLSQLSIYSLDCGYFHTIALTKNGEVYAWGSNTSGVIGIGSEKDHQLLPIKVNGFNNEKVIQISCGYWHSLALTESCHVFSWGNNDFGQLGFEYYERLYRPTQIQLPHISISKISCGSFHSILLSNDGVIYIFGSNRYGQIGNGSKRMQRKPIVLKHEKRFTDIASHWSRNISIALSMDNNYYVWGDCREENILIPIKTEFESFNDIFAHYFECNLEFSQQIIEFSDLSLRNGFFDKIFEEIEKFGEGGYGTVYKVIDKNDSNVFYAVKKISLKKSYESGVLRELNNFNFIRKLILNHSIVEHYDAWLESSREANEIILYISMGLCDKTLEDVINEIDNDYYMKENRVLTPIGYYVVSQLFIEILEGIQYLHKHNVIHRDLNPVNIMLKNDMRKKKFIKIIDFGLIAIHEFSEQLHSPDKGNIEYVAPEVLDGRKYDTKADIYSLGVILRQLFDIQE